MFSLRKKARKIYELGSKIGEGSTCDFYHINGKKKLGVRIFHDREFLIPPDDDLIEDFNNEIRIATLLRKNKIPSPRYAGIVDIFNPITNEFEKGLVIEIIGDETLLHINFRVKELSLTTTYFSPNEIEITIYYDTYVNSNLYSQEFCVDDTQYANYDLCMKYMYSVCGALNITIDNLHCSKQKIVDKLNFSDLQGLYSSKTHSFYFIDLECWGELV
jgi:hypothetical protein